VIQTKPARKEVQVLTREESELLTRAGPGTVMGEVYRSVFAFF
jgi:hypothetical protein